jgi:hypothetical protein
MAYKVPVYDQPTVQEQPLPAARRSERFSPDDFGYGAGANLTKGALQVGNANSEYEARAERAANVTAASKAEAQLQQFVGADLDGDSTNPDLDQRKTGILQSQGDAAFQAANGYGKRWGDEQQRILDTLETPGAKAMFQRRSQRLIDSSSMAVERHVGQQQGVVADATLKANEHLGLSAITNNPLDDGVFATQLGRVSTLIEDNADAQHGLGKDHAITKAAVNTFQGNAYATRIETLLNADETLYPGAKDKARKIFALAQAQNLLGERASGYSARIAQVSADAQGAAKAVKWVTDTTNVQGRPDSATVLKNLRDLENDPKVPDAVKKSTREAVEHQNRLAAERWKAITTDKFDTAVTKLQRNGWNMGAIGNEAAWFQSDDVKEGKLLANLEDKAKEELRAKDTQPPTPAQVANFTSFLFDVSDPANREKYANMNSADFSLKWGGSTLAARDFHQAELHAATLRQQLTKPDAALSKQVGDRLVGAARQSLGVGKHLDPRTWPQAKQDAFKRAYDDLLEQENDAKAHGKKLTDEQVQTTFKKWFQPGTVEGTGVMGSNVFPDSVTRAEAETNASYQGKAFTPTLTDDEKKKYAAKLEASDVVPTEEAIRWAHATDQGQKVPRPQGLLVGPEAIRKWREDNRLNLWTDKEPPKY